MENPRGTTNFRMTLGPWTRYPEILSPVRANYRICIIVSNRNERAKKFDDFKPSRFEILKARILLRARSNSRDELHICAHMMRNKNKVSRTVAAACTGINPWTFEDVCRMPLHKFRVNCTCLSRRCMYSSRDLDLSLPFCLFHLFRFSR